MLFSSIYVNTCVKLNNSHLLYFIKKKRKEKFVYNKKQPTQLNVSIS